MISVFFDRESLGNYKAQQALHGVRTAIAQRGREYRLFHEADEIPPAVRQ